MTLSYGLSPSFLICRAVATPTCTPPPPSSLAFDVSFIKRAAELADKSAGFTAPHLNFGCVIAQPAGDGKSVVVGEGYLYAQGTTPAVLQAVEAGRDRCRGATAYLNMEPNHYLGDQTAVSSLVQAGIDRVVVGIRHPLQHLQGKAIHALRSEGVLVDVLGEDIQCKTIEEKLLRVVDMHPGLAAKCQEKEFLNCGAGVMPLLLEETLYANIIHF